MGPPPAPGAGARPERSARRAWPRWPACTCGFLQFTRGCRSPKLSICEPRTKLLPPAGHGIKHLTQLILYPTV